MRNILAALLIFCSTPITNKAFACWYGPVSEEVALMQADAVVWGSFTGAERAVEQEYTADDGTGNPAKRLRVATFFEFSVKGRIYENVRTEDKIWVQVIGGSLGDVNTPFNLSVRSLGANVILPLSKRFDLSSNEFVITHEKAIAVVDEETLSRERERISAMLSNVQRYPTTANEP
jgi:hypothetical protein